MAPTTPDANPAALPDAGTATPSPRAVLGNLGPNWFASVMGTGIVANAAASLPVHVPGQRVFAQVVWVIAALLLVALVVTVGAHWIRHPTVARTHARNPQMAHFYGAAPMALLTVGAGAVLVGRDLIGERLAVDLDWILWSAGTLGGLFTALTIPYLMFTQYSVEPDAAFGGWLMPVVPPMVSAATGALLIPHMVPGTGRETMLYGCYAMFGLSLVASLIIITLIWSRLAYYGTSGTARVPTLWIVLGPLGQSITAAGLLGTAAAHAVAPEIASGMNVFAILFGVPVWGFAVLWIGLATSLTVRTLRRGMPFALTWWSLTFPVGTFVTGTSQLALHTGLPAFKIAAAVAYIGLLGTWLLVAVRTARGSFRGSLFAAPPPAGPVKAKKDAAM
ncbi:TDT family transporter [Mycolicibacterium komossense]|uniref:TDT family transporter n=1 Tax=Mycolicibacterium komossense TaxID=1779 RepID=A0ABT3CKI9_9MYCO|nr:TDT family transporter [Mycolicibacterium komossense]MCV7229756.1 TDT family transporter [Mycolicibacterium komossense]